MEYIEAEYDRAMAMCRDRFPNGCFEFRLAYGADPETYQEFNRFRWISRKTHTRFRNQYKGPVVLDLTEWANREPNNCLTDFLSYMLDVCREDQCLVISEKSCRPELLRQVCQQLPITKKHLLLQRETHTRSIGFR